MDPVKPDTPTTADVAPAITEPLPVLSATKPPAGTTAPVAPATPPQQAAPAATTNTPCKLPPAMCTPQ